MTSDTSTPNTPNTPRECTDALKRIVSDQLVKINTTRLLNQDRTAYDLHSLIWLSREDPRREAIIQAVKDGGWITYERGAFFSAHRPEITRQGNAAAGEAFLAKTFPTKPEPF